MSNSVTWFKDPAPNFWSQTHDYYICAETRPTRPTCKAADHPHCLHITVKRRQRTKTLYKGKIKLSDAEVAILKLQGKICS